MRGGASVAAEDGLGREKAMEAENWGDWIDWLTGYSRRLDALDRGIPYILARGNLR